MVDIRQEVCGIIVAGTPAPGINGVISAIVIKCLSLDIVPIGFLYGFEYLKQGITKYYQTLKIEDVTRVYNRGGSILYTSKQQIKTADDLENCIRALQHLRVKYLITIGGTETAFSAHKLAVGFRDRSLLLNTSSNNNQNNNKNASATSSPTLYHQQNGNNNNNTTNGYNINENHDNYGILITHVPKTIFNDLPLPPNCFTFGYSTAREIGCKIVADLSADARAMNRWYIITIIGARSGHLTLGIGTASAATICLIPEQFEHKKITKSQQTHQHKTREKIQKTVESLLHSNYTDFMKKQDIPTDLIKSLLDKNRMNEKKDNKDNDDNNNKNNKNINGQDIDDYDDKSDVEYDENDEKAENIINGHHPSNAKKSSRYLNDTGVDFKEYVDILDATMIKRASQGKFYGVAVVGEGLVDLLKQRDLDKYFQGRKDKGHELFGLTLKEELQKRWRKRKNTINMRTKFVGFELRSVCKQSNEYHYISFICCTLFLSRYFLSIRGQITLCLHINLLQFIYVYVYYISL